MKNKALKRDMKNFNFYLKTENEPEEGEIVDEYDLIVSSDEELCMRNRIRQLEAENEEIEQIAVISRSYVDKINHLENGRAAQVPTDVSSISSTEFVTPKKRKRRKSRERKRKHCHRPHQHDATLRYNIQQLPLKTRSKRTHCKRRQKLFAKNHKKNHSDHLMHKEVNEESLSLESVESSDCSILTDTDNCSINWLTLKRREHPYNKGKCITRDTLRLAVARNNDEVRFNSKSYCLKDKLLEQELLVEPTNTAINKRHGVGGRDMGDENNDEDDDVQVIENEPDIHTIEEDSTDSMEEKELRLIALKSAVLKKHMARKRRNAEAAYSPTDFDEMLSSGILRQENKLDDVDVVDLEVEDIQTTCVSISPEASPQLMMLEDQDEIQQMVDYKPVDMDIANSDSEDATVDSWSKDVDNFPKYCLDSYDISKDVQYDLYMQKLHELPPPPPGVDDYEEVPAPPSYHMVYIADNREIDAFNEESAQNRKSAGEQEIYATEEKQTHCDISLLPKTECHIKDDDDDEEEEEALRALLLSKFQTPKNQNKTSANEEFSDRNRSKTIPTEIILKEAVKRLKVHSKVEICKKEAVVGSCFKEKLVMDGNTEEHPENSSDSFSRLDELRNRLSVYKNQSQSVNTDVRKGNVDAYNFEHTATDASQNRMGSEHPIVSNNSGVTNSIDISDITRRLQIIKENVLNSASKISTVNPLPCGNYTQQAFDEAFVALSSNEYKVKEPNQTPTSNVSQLNKTLSNSFVNSDPFKKESNNALTQNKTVKANFDVTANQTTFKITITNNAAFKLEDKDISSAHNDANYKENKDNNMPKSLAVNFNDNKRSKIVESSSKRSVKFTNKITSNGENNGQAAKKPIRKDIKISSASSYILQRTKKIVKPNKVINTNIDLNTKVVTQLAEESTLVLNKSKDEMINKLSIESDNTRLITSIDQVKHMYKICPMVIDLQHSSNESSEDDSRGNYDYVYQPLYDYNDNFSPLSLNLESPCRTPLRSNSPVECSADGIVGHTDSEALNVKTKISLLKKPTAEKTLPTNSPSPDEAGKLNKTPLAVRHLPQAAQSEYRKLVHRMKLLENKRKLANYENNKKQCPPHKKNCTSLLAVEGPSKEKDKSDSSNAVPKTTLVKKVLLRNASNSTTSTDGTTNVKQISNGPSSSNKLHKSNVLRSYENLYLKFGTGIVNNLDKSLKLVEEARKTKLAKLMLENRLRELKAEMDILQDKHKAEQEKISRIYPNICSTNDIITSLKQKRSKVFKAAINLGKTLKGQDYRLNNELKEVITTKSNKLAAEIKIVNSLKAQDFKKKEDATAERQQPHNKGQGSSEDCKTTSRGSNAEVKPNSNTATNNIVMRSEVYEEDKEKHTFESVLKTEISGNTEFQNLVPNILKCDENSADACGVDMNIISNKAHSDNESKQTLHLPSYISPLEHLRNIDSNMDPNGVVCPYDLMGNCEDVTCKYVHITTPKDKT